MAKVVELPKRSKRRKYSEVLEAHGLSVPENILETVVNDGLIILDTDDGLTVMNLTTSNGYTLLGMLETAKAHIVNMMQK
jgi:hypothetical protein